MAIVYFDASALVKLIIEEPGSDIAAGLWDGCDAAITSRLSYPEVRAALAAAARDHRIDDQALAEAERTWDEYWSALRLVELSQSVMQQAGDLVGVHALRGADGVHLASALAVPASNIIVAVWDKRLAQGVLSVGLALAPNPDA